MAKTNTQSKSQAFVDNLKDQPKSLVGQLRTLLPLIEDLRNEGHTMIQVMEALRKTGMVFTDYSFHTSLKRARRSLKAVPMTTETATQPVKKESENQAAGNNYEQHSPVTSSSNKSENEKSTVPIVSRVVKPQPSAFTTHKKDPSDEDFL